ncbi:ligand-binding sensor domain-containing protein [Reichenbachiella ulvae]|uniref:histidine kinase n=1 Tax=Reichenbachiella ulvae TaxID=2980104 RepID=A0ABT3CTF3_9BACT|nr:sensor histidine kinase [Reichenbachiella ulvae]MCV9386518.1 ATP-binding protein [Reichenbachiella ulvae]
MCDRSTLQLKGAYLQFFITGTILLFFYPCWSQTPNIQVNFQNINNEKGLSQGSITDIIQDSKGFIWIGTHNGLNKYNGDDFQIYHHIESDSTSLSDNSISCLMMDNQGSLWIGTAAGGFNRYDESTDAFTQYLLDPTDQDEIRANAISTLFQDSQGRYWIGTDGYGLALWHPTKGLIDRWDRSTEDSTGIRNNYIKQVYQDRQGQLWLVHDNGITQFAYDGEFQILNEFKSNPKNPSLGLPSSYAKQIIQQSESLYWIATDDGVSLFDQSKNRFKHFQAEGADPKNHIANNYCKTLALCDRNNLWIGTDHGISIIDTKTFEIQNHSMQLNDENSLVDDYVKVIFKDKEERLWIGTDEGISVYDSKKEQFQLLEIPNSCGINQIGNNVFDVLQDDHYLWIGTDHGLYLIRNSDQKVFYYTQGDSDPNNLKNEVIKEIYRDSSGQVWIGTDHGLNLAIMNSNQEVIGFKQPINNPELNRASIRSILEDNKKRIWIGTWGMGLTILTKDSNQIHRGSNHKVDSGLKSGIISNILQDKKGRIWVLTARGLNLYLEESKTFKNYHHKPDNPNSLSSPHPTSMLIDGNQIWIGTNGGGLNKFNPETEEFVHYSLEALKNLTIYSIQKDKENHLWLGTSNGIIKYDPIQNLILKFEISNGLQGNEFNMNSTFQTEEGVIYFGGHRGLNYFNPSELETNQNVPEVYITDFFLFNEPVDIRPNGVLEQNILTTDHIHLDYDQNILSFRFVGLNYRNSEKNQYAYQLDGYDKTWIRTEQSYRQANYSNVPPGDYTFKVTASNDDGLWNKAGASIRVSISPPWWQSTAAYVLYALLFIALGPGIYTFRILKYKQQEEELERLVKKRTNELSKQKELVEERNLELHAAHEEINHSNNKLRELNATLEERVNQRTEELQKVVSDLQERNINLEQFNYIISHNMRAPVSNLKGLLGLYNHKDPNDPFNKTALDQLEKSCGDLDEVLKDLTKILEVKKDLDQRKEIILITELIEKIKSSLKKEIKKAEVTIELDLQVDSIKSVSSLWYSIFTNLLSNAIKYRSKDRPCHIKISSFKTNGLTTFTFEDNGIGIDLKLNKNKIFGLYKRFHSHVEGKGMGLFMVKTQVQSLGGNITIKSTPDEGTKFTITL